MKTHLKQHDKSSTREWETAVRASDLFKVGRQDWSKLAGSGFTLVTTISCLLCTLVGAVSAAGVSGPKIQFATLVHDFGKIKGGEVVKYTFSFTNGGDRLLEITAVHPSCGCTTAGEWSRQVEPGKTGSIPIQFNSGNFNGQIGKTITVSSNDTNQPTVMLQIKGTIWKPIDVNPQFAVLNVTPESPLATTAVRIVNHEETPLTLSTPEGNNPAFAAELKTNQPGKEFDLVVKTVSSLPAGNVQGQFTLKTSSTNVPVIKVSVWANVQQTVIVMPSQITLPAGPLANQRSFFVTIRNNGTNAMVLTEPGLNAKGVEVDLKELLPGRYFRVTLSFPVGFQMTPGGPVELRMKSNNPQFPILKVPVTQAPRVAPIAVPPPGQVTLPARSSAAGGR